MDEKKITPFYTDDHEQLDSYLRKFEELKRQNYPQAKEYFKKFKFGLQRHIVWEEEILYPIFEEKTSMKNSGPRFAMREEHRKIEELLENLHKKVQHQNLESDQEEQLLWNILYPAIDKHTSLQEQEKISNSMHSQSARREI